MNSKNALEQMFCINADNNLPLVFWGINIEQDHDNIRNYVKWCKRQGLGGFNIIIGSGCEGRANEQWISKLLDAYEVAFKTAEEEGLKVWIFDDWGYPSGTAGGLVCTEDSYRLKRMYVSHDLTLEPGNKISVTMPEKLISAAVLLPRGESKKLDAKPGQQMEYCAGNQPERLVVVAWEYDKHMSKSSCRSYPGDPAMSCIDMLNPKATRKFLEVMHERYYKRFSHYFGNVIKGFFYDEPYLSFEFPWTEALPEVFKEKKGYDIVEVLPQLLANIHSAGRGPVAKYADDYFDVWTEMASKAYYGEMAKWCHEHGVELAGHQDLDHHLNTLNTISGHFYKNMRNNDRPTVDVIWAQIEPGPFVDFPRYAGSVKHLLGKKHATAETFAAMGYALHGDIMRYITDHQTIRGIDDFHLMYSSNKPPIDEEYSPMSPNHMLQTPFGPTIFKRMAKASALSLIGSSACTTALFIPSHDIYRTQMRLRSIGINNADDLPWEWVDRIAKHLTYMPCDFCYIWEEAINELSVTDGGLLTGSGHIIDTIILPPDCTLSEELIEKLRLFSQKGGRIITIFKPVWALEKESILCSQVTSLSDLIKRRVRTNMRTRISLCTRIDGDKTIYMLLNESREMANVELTIDGTGILYEASLSDGRMTVIKENAPFKFNTTFAGSEMKVYIVDASGKKPELDVLPASAYDNTPIVPENWIVELPDGNVRKLCGDSWPDWAQLGFPGHSGHMTYKAEFELASDLEFSLLKAEGLHYHAIVSIDGKEVGRIAYQPYELFIKGLGKGKHTLELMVYNTSANAMCGTLEIEKERYKGRFAYMANHDRKRLKSGLVQPAVIIPVK